MLKVVAGAGAGITRTRSGAEKQLAPVSFIVLETLPVLFAAITMGPLGQQHVALHAELVVNVPIQLPESLFNRSMPISSWQFTDRYRFELPI